MRHLNVVLFSLTIAVIILTPGDPISYLFVVYLMMLEIEEMERMWKEAAVT